MEKTIFDVHKQRISQKRSSVKDETKDEYPSYIMTLDEVKERVVLLKKPNSQWTNEDALRYSELCDKYDRLKNYFIAKLKKEN